MKSDEQIYCVEYSEYSHENGMFPFHLGTVKDAITHNLQDMYYNHRKENKWQIVFIGTLKECSKELTTLEKNKKRLDKKTRSK